MTPEHDDGGKDQEEDDDDEANDDARHQGVPVGVLCLIVDAQERDPPDVVARGDGEPEEGAAADCMDEPHQTDDHLVPRVS